MDPGRRPPDLWDSLSDHVTQSLRVLKGLQNHHGPPQLERGVRIRTNRSREVVSFRKPARLPVETRQQAARIVDLDRIQLRQDLQQILFLPVPAPPLVEGVRYAYERALILQAADRLLRCQSFRDLFSHKRSQKLAAGRGDLLAYDDPLRVDRMSRPCACDGVVIRHHHAVNPLASTGPDQMLRSCERVLRKDRMTVEFYTVAV